jgi:hypothetical protein
VLFLSVKGSPQNAGRGPALEALAPAGAVASAVLDVKQLRAMIREAPELAKALFDGRTPAAAYGESIEAMCERSRVDPAALRRSGWVKGLAGLMLVKYANLTQREAAGRLGLATGAGVSYQVRKLHRQMASHANLRQQVAKATNVLEASRECRGNRIA